MKPSNAALAVLLSGALLLAGGRASATPGSDGGAALLAEDYPRALMHMEAGAEAKEPRSMHGLGVLYQNGHGVKKDLSLAQKWYGAALEEALHHQSDPDTQFTLGLIYHDGHGAARDFKQAYEWFEKASSQGHGDATNSMAVMQERGLGIPRNAAAARDLYSKAALQGSTRAQYQMAVMYALGQGLPKDHRKAIKWCSSAAAKGYPQAELFLGGLYTGGDGVAPEYEKTFSWIDKAASRGYAPAQYTLGTLYEIGRGTPINVTLAYKWYLLAEAKGFPHAKPALARFDGALGPIKSSAARECAKEILTLPDDTPLGSDCPTSIPVPILVEVGTRNRQRILLTGAAKRTDGRPSVEVYLSTVSAPDVIHYDRDGNVINKESENEKGYITTALRYERVGNFPVAHIYLQKALRQARKTGDRRLEAEALGVLGRLFRNYGDYEKAFDHYRQALQLQTAGSDILERGRTLGGIAEAYTDLGDFDNALQSARELAQTTHHPDALSDLGFVLLQAGEPVQALDKLQNSLTRARLSGSSPLTTENNIGIAYLDMGRYQEAEAIFRRANDLDRLALSLMRHGGYSEAQRLLSHDLSHWESTGRRDILLARYTGLGLAAEGLGQNGDARKHFLRAFEINEKIREGLSPEYRAFFMAGSARSYPYLEGYEGLVRHSASSEAFHYSEFTHSRAFSESIAKKRGALDSLIPRNLADEDARLGEDMTALSRERNEAYFRNERAKLDGLAERLVALKEKRESLIGRLRKTYPKYTYARYPEPVRAEAARIKPGEVMIYFEVMEPYTKAFIIRAGSIAHALDIPVSRKRLGDMVKEYLAQLSRVTKSSDLAGYDPSRGKRLFDIVLRPVLEAKDGSGRNFVTKSSQIIIVPDEMLGILPFESLPMALPKDRLMPLGRHGPVPAGVKYVGDDYDIAYAQSATALSAQRVLKKTQVPSRKMLVVADPIFNPADSRLRGADAAPVPSEKMKRMGGVVKYMGLGGGRSGLSASKQTGSEAEFFFPRLDQTSLLAKALQRLFTPDGTFVLSGESASERSLRNQSLSKFRYLVFATHGILDQTVPGIREPALVFNQLESDKDNDGFLTMTEVMGLDLNADIVALTACQTGLGKQVSGEGVMGLGRAFQHAGARNVLVSLWNVAEDSTVKLTDSFFRHVEEGKTPREAIRLARADIRREGYGHPFYWAPFILFAE